MRPPIAREHPLINQPRQFKQPQDFRFFGFRFHWFGKCRPPLPARHRFPPGTGAPIEAGKSSAPRGGNFLNRPCPRRLAFPADRPGLAGAFTPPARFMVPLVPEIPAFRIADDALDHPVTHPVQHLPVHRCRRARYRPWSRLAVPLQWKSPTRPRRGRCRTGVSKIRRLDLGNPHDPTSCPWLWKYANSRRACGPLPFRSFLEAASASIRS